MINVIEMRFVNLTSALSNFMKINIAISSGKMTMIDDK